MAVWSRAKKRLPWRGKAIGPGAEGARNWPSMRIDAVGRHGRARGNGLRYETAVDQDGEGGTGRTAGGNQPHPRLSFMNGLEFDPGRGREAGAVGGDPGEFAALERGPGVRSRQPRRRLGLGDQAVLPLHALDLPDAEGAQHREGQGAGDRQSPRKATGHLGLPRKLRICRAIITPLPGRIRPRDRPRTSGRAASNMSQIGGFQAT